MLDLIARMTRPAPVTTRRSEPLPSWGEARRHDDRPVLKAHDLVRGFGSGTSRTLALQGVSLELHRGELSLLMGPSGSGKSTLLAILSGLLHPDEGRVEALGRDLWAMSDDELERFRLKHCSYIFQGYNLFPALSALQQLEIVLRWGEGVPAPQARKRAEHILARLGLANKLHLRPAQLSGGEKQRVAIGRALIKEPTFLFADEPTSALDWENGQGVIELLRQAAHERGASVLVVSHDPRLVPHADRVFHLEDGLLTDPPEGQPLDQTPIPMRGARERTCLCHLSREVSVG
jgi:putative ABC transport system ATP-binding protein